LNTLVISAQGTSGGFIRCGDAPPNPRGIIGLVERGAKIIFTRPKGHYRDALRSYTLEVDGLPRGHIMPGQSVVVDIEPGPHSVRAQISWTGSPRVEVNLEPDETARLLVEPAGTPAQALWQVIGRTRYLHLTAEPS
jgi:hypothetical protein